MVLNDVDTTGVSEFAINSAHRKIPYVEHILQYIWGGLRAFVVHRAARQNAHQALALLGASIRPLSLGRMDCS